MGNVNVLAKADYTQKELALCTPNRKRIAKLTGEEWAMEWEKVCSSFRKAAEKNKELRRIAELNRRLGR